MARKVSLKNRKRGKPSGQDEPKEKRGKGSDGVPSAAAVREQGGRERSSNAETEISVSMVQFGPEITHYFNQWCTPKGFLEYVANKFEWEVLPNAVFMDVGCGDAEVQLAQYILDRFPETSQVLAIDKEIDVIHRHNSAYKEIPRIKFRAADIEDHLSLQKWVRTIDKVLSLNCFHMLYKPITAFANIFNLLKPGGEAALVFCHRSGYVGWHKEMSEKWSQYLVREICPNVPVTQDEDLNLIFYGNWLKRIGFEVVLLKNDVISTLYKSEEDLKEHLFKLGHEAFAIPDHKRQEFEVDLMKAFLQNNPRTSCGILRQVSCFITTMVRKPTDRPKFDYFTTLR